MRIQEERINTQANKETSDAIRKLATYVFGELSNNSIEFLENICNKNPSALNKILLKCEKLSLKIRAYDIDLVIKSIQSQMQLPEDILATIHSNLACKKMYNLANVLHIFAEKIEKKLTNSEHLKTTIQITNNLNIFAKANPNEQFLRSLIIMMLNFHNKEYTSERLLDTNKRNNYDSAKWLKSLLCLSEKSKIINLIDFIDLRLQLSSISVSGKIKDMELIELFFLFEEVAISSEVITITLENKSFIKNINAILLVNILCKKNPIAFFDFIIMQLNSKHLDLFLLIEQYSKNLPVLEKFFTSDIFNPYFRKNTFTDKANRHAFLFSISENILKIVTNYNTQDYNMKSILEFIEKCHLQSHKMSDSEYFSWLQTIKLNTRITDEMITSLFNALEYNILKKEHQITSLSFITTKMISMGFSPRASSFTNVGIFQPLITNTQKIELKNIQALKYFYQQLNSQEKNNLIMELIVSFLTRYRSNPLKIETHAKASYKRQIDVSYPLPTLHNIKKTQNSRTLRAVRKQPTYQGTFFASPSRKIKASRNFSKVMYQTRVC